MPAMALSEAAVHLRPEDNVVVAARTIPEGTDLAFEGERVRARRVVKLGHKMAVRPIKKGEAVRKYGQVIGFAGEDIAPGDLFHVHNVRAALFERAYAFCQDRPEPPAPAEPRFFEGYDRGSE